MEHKSLAQHGGVGALNSHIFQPKWYRGWQRNKGTSEGRVRARGEGGRAISYHTSVFWPLVLAMMDSKAGVVYCYETDSYVRACWWFMTAPGGICKNLCKTENCYKHGVFIYFRVWFCTVILHFSAYLCRCTQMIFYLISLLRDIQLVSRTASFVKSNLT